MTIYLIGCIARLIKLLLDPLLLRDSVLYLHLADIWFETGDYANVIKTKTITPPLPLYLIKKTMLITYSSEIAGRSISLFLSSMIPVFGYIIALKLFKKVKVAIICAFLLVFHPKMISYSIQPLRENYYLFFLGLVIIFAIKGIKDHKAFIASGVFLSFAIFCRYEAIETLLIIPIVMGYSYSKRQISLRGLYISLCSFCFGCITTCFILLSITNYDLSFISKMSQYTENIVIDNDVQNFFYNDSQIGQ